MLQSEQFYDFFKYVEVSTFDIASDAFSTFKVYFWLRDHEKKINAQLNSTWNLSVILTIY